MGTGNIFQKLGEALFGVRREREVYKYPVEEQLIRDSKIIKAQQQQIRGRDAQLSKKSAEENEEKLKEGEKDYQTEIARRLREKQKEIRKKRFKRTFSLRYFFNKCGFEKRATNFGKTIDITDKDDTTIFGTFGDLIVTDNGLLLITDDKGNILNMAKLLPQLIWKPDALPNYMKRKRIPLAVDENFNPIPDLEEEVHPDVIYDEEEKEYAETKLRKRPVKIMLIEKEEKIREYDRTIQRLEKVLSDKTNTIFELNRSIRFLQNRSDSSQAQLSGVLEKSMQFENKIAGMQGQISQLTQLKADKDILIERFKSTIRDLMDRLDSYGNKTLAERIRADLKDDIDYFSNILPEQIVKEVEVPGKTRELAKPGQNVR